MFCPPQGTVFDPFGGALTTSIACLQKERACTAMDSSTDEFWYAKSLLRIFANPKATMEELQTYCDPVNLTEVEASPTESDATANSRRITRSSEQLRSTPSTKKRRIFPQHIDTVEI